MPECSNIPTSILAIDNIIEGIQANTAIRVIHSDGSVSWVFPNGLSNLGLRYREHSNDY